jgi:polysaccharide deacetylase family protein (PEP-CTERM system associated)
MSLAAPLGAATDYGNRHAFTVDVEEWYQVGAFERTIDRDEWPLLESRVERQTYTILEKLSDKQVKGTFFCLGWVAERHPLLISAIHSAGHEVACHGSAHQRLFRMEREAIVQDIATAKARLEDACGAEVTGYRAPSFSLTKDVWYVYEILEELGFRYSSSLYPVKTDHYGLPDAPRTPFWPIGKGRILEVPLSVCHLFGKALPASGGGYFRLLPYPVGKGMFMRSAAQTGSPAIFYMHPWEIDPDQPYMVKAPALSRFRHYTGQRRMLAKVGLLLDTSRWGTMQDIFLPSAYAETPL